MTNYFVSLKKANADNARLVAEHAAVTGERDTLTAALVERDTAAEAVRTQFDASLADLTEKLSVASAQVAALTASAQTAATQAAELIAAQGVPLASLPKDSTSTANAAALGAQIRAEADPAKRAALYAQLQSVWNSKN
tara:strand:+ start:137 stop:550 length:414 start_codon:yes stop_codon:yes gene_type:complete